VEAHLEQGDGVSRVGVVVNTAVDAPDEAAVAARRIAAALSGVAGAEMLVADLPDGGGWELGLPGKRFAATEPLTVRREALAAVLAAAGEGSLPACACLAPDEGTVSRAIESAWLEACGGHAPGLISQLADDGYDAAVFFDLGSATTVHAIDELPSSVPVALVPLLASPRILRLPGVRRALQRADTVLAVSEYERRLLEPLAPGKVTTTTVPLRAEVAAHAERPPDAPERPFVLVLADWSDVRRGRRRRREAARLARRLAAHDVVVLTEEFIYPALWPPELTVRPGGSRRDLWRWMRWADAVVDLECERVIGRDVREALQCGTPVVVPEHGVGRHLVEHSGQGAWYRGHADIAAAIDLLARDTDRTSVPEPPADVEAFTESVQRWVGGLVGAAR
jgi:hypothetical protein